MIFRLVPDTMYHIYVTLVYFFLFIFFVLILFFKCSDLAHFIAVLDTVGAQ